jgi:hypothetical protein
MATLFLDFENGDDNHAGDSFSVSYSGTDGRVVSGTLTFSSASANFPDDGSLINRYISVFDGSIYRVWLITARLSSTSLTVAPLSGGLSVTDQSIDRQYYIGGRWKSLTSGATVFRTIPGDTIRIMGSPAPTSLGQNGVWTSQALQATKITAAGSTNTTPITVTVNSHGYSTGDTVVMAGDTGNTAANGTWEITVTGTNTFTLDGSVGNGTSAGTRTARLRNNTRVMLASPVTQNIASTGPGRAAWTPASADVTATLSTTSKEHVNSDTFAIATGFTTGLVAYWATGTLDLSGYQQVSFWIQQAGGTIGAAGAVDLRLCSDAAGVTAVNTISIPSLGALNRWMPVTVDLGTALGNSIQSIAFYVNTDNGTQTFRLNNIIACKASSEPDSLTLTSLIGKNVEGETFWGIQSINGTRVMLDADTNAAPTSATLRGYYGTSETVTTWKRETIKLGPAATLSALLNNIQESGTDGSPITYSGGWDRTAMSTQNLETWLDGQNGNGYASNNGESYTVCEKLAFVRFAAGYVSNIGRANTASIIATNNCATATNRGALFVIADINCYYTLGHAVANANLGVFINSSSSVKLIIDYGILSNGGNGIGVQGEFGGQKLKGSGAGLSANNGANGLLVNSCTVKCKSLTFENNATSSVVQSASFSDNNFFEDCLFSDSTAFASLGNLGDAAIYSQNHDQVVGNHRIVFNGGVIVSATDERKTASGISWKLQPTSTSLRTSVTPLYLSLAKVACAANSLVTIKAWMRRSDTGLTMRLVCKGGQIAGVTSDVVDSMTAAADTWAEQTITFTPTEVGVVEITAEAFGGTTFSGWVDDLTISQA